ncbi:MAG: ATP-dependent protease subunit HslV [bacterium]|nr:ATP-dependent protease subunit HslV [bacterium]
MDTFQGTTVLGIRRDGVTTLAADGQVTFGTAIVKGTARKIMRLHNDKVLVGFAGAVADAQTLAERFEGKLEEFHGNLPRAAVELAREWRTDKYLRRLESMLLVGNSEHILLISGSGEVIQPDGDVMAIGSGAGYALAAARVLMKHTKMNAREIAEEALRMAAEICIYTNDNIIVETV